MIISLSVSACGRREALQNETDFPYYANYSDIPGVTEEEILAIEKIKASGKTFVFGATPSTEAFFRVDGSPGGYCGLLLKRLSGLFDIPFDLSILEWGELIEGLDKKFIDFSGELTATPEREKKYFMTVTSSERSIKIMRAPGSEALDRIARTRPLNLGFLEGTTTIDSVGSFITNAYTSIFIDDYHEAYSLLEIGDIDAFFDENPAEAAFDPYGEIVAEDFFPLIYSPVSITTGNSELAPFISVLNKYLSNGGTRELAAFSAQGYQEYLRNKFLTMLDEEETLYLNDILEQGGVIPIGAEFDNYPVSFWNEQEKEYQGIALDVLKEIEKLSSLNFIPRNKSNDDFSVLLKMLETGEAEVVTELIQSPDRQGLFLWPEIPYSIDYYVLISKIEFRDISINEVLYSRIGLIADYIHSQVFKEWFSHNSDVVEFKNNLEAIEALQNGEIDLLMANHNLLLWITNFLEMPGYKANIVFNRNYESHFGFNKNNALLCSIVNKALKLINTSNLADRWTRRVFDYRGKMARAQVPLLGGSLALFVAVVFLLAVVLVRKRNEGKRLEYIIRLRTKELEAQTSAAIIASRAKGDFLAHMSHEIRTPLNAIIGMTNVAKKYLESPKTKSALEEISKASNHLLGILNDILDMSKIESGKFVLIHDPFVLLDALEEVSEIIKVRCEEKQQQFISTYEKIPNVSVLGDKLRLKQVLINLLGNAVKFTPERGKIELLCSNAEAGCRELFITFSIIDSGIGMTPEQINKLFNPFEQTDNSIAIRFGGTGLGLVISQDLVNQMGGKIVVKSNPGEGSVFSFTIGLEVTEFIKKDIIVPDDYIPDLKGKRLLLAEDIEINRVIIAELLSETNVTIDEAEDGRKAVDIFSSAIPGYYDFIFMDIQMPNMNGYDAARLIREAEKERCKGNTPLMPVPIYAMTANAYREDIEKAIEAGMNGHIAKPVDVKILMKVLGENFPA